MNKHSHFRRRQASALMSLAAWMVPSSSNEWAKAMQTEFDSMEKDSEALSWAAGCVIAGIVMRLDKIIGNLVVSRWVLSLELIACLFPLTFVWLESLFWFSMINLENFNYWKTAFMPPVPYIVMSFSTMVLGTMGPLGLILGFRSIILGVRLPGKITRLLLFAGPLVLGLIDAVCWLLMGVNLESDYWSSIILVSVLPALCVTHLIYIYSPDKSQPMAIR